MIHLTVEDAEKAREITDQLLIQRLSNHVEIIEKGFSRMWQNGKIITQECFLLLIKTKALLYLQVENLIRRLHPEGTTKMFSVPITQIDQDYFNDLRKGLQHYTHEIISAN